MPTHDLLIMAVTRMLSGVCTAGFINEPHPASILRWVRPVKEHGTLLLGDLCDAEGRLIALGDVVALHLETPRTNPPHVEDWVVDFVHRRPQVVRRLEGERRARFLAEHLDRSPENVLVHGARSLCLLRPERCWANWVYDSYSGKHEARMGFTLASVPEHEGATPRGLPVTDLKWRALGRRLLNESGEPALTLEPTDLMARLPAEMIYLTIGLSRTYQGRTWPLIIGVHPVPDYACVIDCANL